MRSISLSIGIALWCAVCSAQRPAPARVSDAAALLKEPKSAVVVGINDYQEESGIPKLTYAASDAEAFASALTAIGYKDVVVLENPRATATIIRHKVQEMADDFRDGQGTIVFYFSGHGAQVTKGKDEEQYLLLWETDRLEIEKTGLRMNEIQNILKGSKARQKMMFFDSCRSEPAQVPATPKTAIRKDVNPPMSPWTELKAAEGIRILNATQKGGVSIEDLELQHGVFTYYLIDGLTKAKRPDGIVTFNELQRWVTNNVEAHVLTLKDHPKQVPYATGEANGDFFITGQIGVRRAMVFGNQSYKRVEDGKTTDQSLLSSKADANAVWNKLKSLGYEMEPPVIDKTAAEMDKALKDFSQKIKPEDSVLVYYAGAGAIIDGDATFLSTEGCIFDDAKRARVRDEPCYSGLALTNILSAVKAGRFGPTIVMMDMCLSTKNGKLKGRPKSLEKQYLLLHENTLCLFATDIGYLAYEDEQGGVFTTCFLKMLNDDPNLSTDQISKLSLEVSKKVKTLDKEADQSLNPVGNVAPAFSFRP